jgi:hypothetical protein
MRRSTPSAGIEIVFGVPPLDLYIQFTATNTFNRLKFSPYLWEGSRGKWIGHIKWLESKALELTPGTLIDRCITYRWNRQFSTYIGDGKDVP